MSDTIRGNDESLAASGRREVHTLTVVSSPDAAIEGRRVTVTGGQTLFIGRDAPGGLSVKDERMSKLHWLVASAKGEITFADIGSTNGTLVNGVPASTAPLRHGDVIRAGDSLFVVSFRDFSGEIQESAKKVAGTRFPILLQGETGTGKELLALSIHEQSGRTGPFVPLNCATLTPELAAGELFGHARGAFSGATAARAGLFRAAEGGTLFLDEVGDLPLDLQPALLRGLEERKVRPVGADHEVSVDVRVLAATHVDLEQAVARSVFRADLLARLAHVVLRLPPLRERRHEILELARIFSPGVRFSTNAKEALLLWNWPRNVRELRAVVEVAVVLGRDRVVGLGDLHERLPEAAERVKARQPREIGGEQPANHPLADRRERLRSLFEQHGGNVSKVAGELGKPRAQVYRWLKALGLDADSFRTK